MSSLSSDLRSNRTDRTSIFLVGNVNHQITGFKLPSNRQVLAVLFFNLREVNLTVKESATLTIRECLIFWEKARIPTKHPQNCIKKLEDLYESWRRLQKNASKSQNVYRERENEFQNILDNLFDVAHADALKNIEKEEDRIFLQRQREPGRVGYLAGVDKNLAKKEERIRQRIEAEERRRQMYLEKSAASTSSDGCNSENLDKEDVSSLSSDEDDKVKNGNKRGTKDLLSPKVVAVLDRCQLSTRDTVFLLQAVLEELGFDTDEFSISQSSIQRKRVERREERAKFIKETFQNEVPEVVTVHWDGKLMPAPNPRESKEERLPIIITHQNGEQLIDVPNLENSTGKAQAKAVFDALSDWNLVDKVQIMCCDTTASNTGCYNGACVLLEQYLDRDLLLFACRHHVYELVLKGVFESKLPQVTSSPDTPLFKNFRDGWKNIDSTNFESGIECISHLSISEINDLSTFYHDELQKPAIRDDYQELIQLCILFLDRDVNQNLKIHPPGAINQARWMARAIYSLKIFLLKSQCDLTEEEEEGLKAVCCFIVSTYVKPWLECILAVKAPYQDLCFLKSLKAYENVDKTISDAALKSFVLTSGT